MKVEKTRLDVLLAQRGLAESRSLAQKLIMAGDVRVDGQVVADPSRKVALDAALDLEKGPKFVSRGGEKLEPALLDFGLADLTGWVCADVGASTGGFTDCLLQHGALKVFAIDVGYGILHWKMRSDPRVVVMERTNARHVGSLPEIPALVTVDASFISLRILLPVIHGWFDPPGSPGSQNSPGGHVIALIKPQFEAGKEAVDRGEGVIHDPRIHRQVLEDVLTFAQEEGFGVRGLVKSSLKGPKGNTEFLVHLGVTRGNTAGFERSLIDQALK
jgi:23S rRNA (cytidine1920-2'-O)/16S rRNA (cytidine1409-2'-O)-methyltransferase